MTETPALNPVIAEHLAAVNAHDEDAIVATFAPDALVNDARREFWGTDAIRRWVAKEVVGDRKVEEACLLVASVAQSHFEAAQQVFDRTPRRARRTPRIMGEAYRYILGRLYARGWAPPRTKLKLGKTKLILIVARCFVA